MTRRWEQRIVVFCVVIIIFSLAASTNIQGAHSEETNEEKAWIFLRDVVEIDTAKYDAEFVNYYPNNYGNAYDYTGTYILTSGAAEIRASFAFKNNRVVSCKIFPVIQVAQLIFNEGPTSPINRTINLLNRYELFSKADYVQTMQNLLRNVKDLNDTVKTEGDIRLTVSLRDLNLTFFTWMRTVNGITNNYNGFWIGLRDGAFDGFSDHWSLYEVGSSEVKVSSEEAVGIGVERLKNFSYDVGGHMIGNLVPLANVTLYPRLTMEPREGLLYPMWEMYIPLDHTYPGNVYAVHLYIWAHTGEIHSITPSSTLGDTSQPQENPVVMPTPTPTVVVVPTVSPHQTPQLSPTPSIAQQPTPSASQFFPSTSPTQSPEPTVTASSPPSASVSSEPSSIDGSVNASDGGLVFGVAVVCGAVAVAAVLALALRKRRASE